MNREHPFLLGVLDFSGKLSYPSGETYFHDHLSHDLSSFPVCSLFGCSCGNMLWVVRRLAMAGAQ